MYEPTKFVPVAGDDPVVAPVIAQVSPVTEQLSLVTGLEVATVAVQVPGLTLAVKLPGHVMVGDTLSSTVTVKEQVTVLFEPSLRVYVTVVTPALNDFVPT